MSDLNASTALCGIVLHPAGHTRSPAMHRAAYQALDLDAHYEVFDTPPSDLARVLDHVRDRGFRQIAVSIPHKEAVIGHLDRLDEVARKIGAVNTVTRIGDEWVGSNTDHVGAVRALKRMIEPAGKRAVVLGAGGAARAVVSGLIDAGAEVHVLNRTLDRAQQLAEALGAEGSGSLNDLGNLTHDILVNTTSVGLGEERSPVDPNHLNRGSVVMDAVYEPEVTRLLADAKQHGAQTLPGKWMLVYQAAAQLEIWSEHNAPIDAMAKAFDQAGRL